MLSSHEETTVAIIGAGVSGLTLATFLRKSGVPCIVLERRDRAYVEQRKRAGFLEARGVRMFERWGLLDLIPEGPDARTVDFRVNGSSHISEYVEEDGNTGRFCTQQMLVNNLLRELIDTQSGDARFEITDITIHNDEDRRPQIAYSDASGSHTIVCDYIVGCDGYHGISRSSIPHGILTTYSYEYGYAWLAAHVAAPVTEHPIMAVSDRGFAAQLPRGPHRSRYYLQCALSDGPEDWPADHFWDEIRLRLGDPDITTATIEDKVFVPLRSVVHTPMQYRNLFLVGDAAHIVPPTAAKGMNLALYDVDILSQALLKAIQAHDRSALDTYSDTCLPHIWATQENSASMTDMMHDAGDPTQHGTFRQMLARTRLRAMAGGV